jgi:hypothetical protein
MREKFLLPTQMREKYKNSSMRSSTVDEILGTFKLLKLSNIIYTGRAALLACLTHNRPIQNIRMKETRILSISSTVISDCLPKFWTWF